MSGHRGGFKPSSSRSGPSRSESWNKPSYSSHSDRSHSDRRDSGRDDYRDDRDRHSDRSRDHSRDYHKENDRPGFSGERPQKRTRFDSPESMGRLEENRGVVERNSRLPNPSQAYRCWGAVVKHYHLLWGQ
jgi:hypothetical protein